MTILLTLVHVGVCTFLILVVLLQSGKGADLAGAFGGGGSQTAFGARGATTMLHKLTTGAAVLFMATSFTLAVLATRAASSVVEEAPGGPPAASAPAETTPAPDAAPAATDEDTLEDGEADDEGAESTDPSGS